MNFLIPEFEFCAESAKYGSYIPKWINYDKIAHTHTQPKREENSQRRTKNRNRITISREMNRIKYERNAKEYGNKMENFIAHSYTSGRVFGRQSFLFFEKH